VNNRRKLVIALGAGALTTPFASWSQQQGKVWRIGFLSPRAMEFNDSDYYYGPFRQGMRELGYVEGKNLLIEWRPANGNNERLPDLAAELVNLKVDVIVAPGTPATSAAKKASITIPIVMVNTGDPIGSGFIKSLARPEGNITGLSNMGGDLSLKHLEMLLSMVPKLSRVAYLLNPTNAIIRSPGIVQAAGQKRGIEIIRVDARTPGEIETAFSSIHQQNAGAMMVVTDPLFQGQRNRIAELAAKSRLPAIASDRMYAEAGVLLSYGQSIAAQFRGAAIYVDRIIKGAKPADLPVEQPTKFELIINGKTAKALGLTIPQSLLISADKVIE